MKEINKTKLPTVAANYPCAVYTKELFASNPMFDEYQKYRAFLNTNANELLEKNNWNRVFEVLDRLTLDPEYVLDDLRPKESTDSTLTLYARPISIPHPSEEKLFAIERTLPSEEQISIGIDKDGEPFTPHYDNHFEYITLNDDPMSIWHALLLHSTDNFIGFRWHGCYANREFITSYRQLRDKNPKLIDWHVNIDRFLNRDMFEKDDMFEENIIEDDDIYDKNCDFLLNPNAFDPVIDKKNHTIKFLWWSEWSGLSYVTFPFKYNADKKTIKFEYYTEENLIPYDCGIRY